MKRKLLSVLLSVALVSTLFVGCGSTEKEAAATSDSVDVAEAPAETAESKEVPAETATGGK